MLSSVETRSVSPVFVGRAAELAVLGDALDRIAASGEPQALLIGGEAGVGKTRLIEEFGELARARGALVALGGCIEIGSEGLPFAPFSAILHTLNWHLRDELAAAVAGQEGELSRILPELGETPGEAHDEETGRARLFELTARLLERLAAHRTLVIVIEDLHWADRSTRELLAYLLKALHDAGVLLVATYRSDDIHRRHPLRPFLAEIDRMRTVRRVELARFNREEVRSQIAGINGSEPEKDTVDRVYKRSEGNAFFVEELARGLADGCLHGLSDPLRDLLLVRVEALPEDAQRVVRTAAEGGSTVEHELLAAVCRMPEDDLIEALRAAVGSNTLVPTQDGTGYRFRHALAREAVVDDLLPGERTRLNRRYAEALEANPSLVRTEVCAARLASYWYKAHDAAKALPAVLAASVQARRRHAYAEQLRLLDRALELWDDAPTEVRQGVRPVDYAEAYPACGSDGGDALRFLDLLAEISVAARLSGDIERAFTITKRALRSLPHENDPLRKAWFLVQRSRLCQGTGRGNGWEDLGSAQELVRGLPPSSVHAEVLAAVAGWEVLHEPGPGTFATAERAVELAQLVGDEHAELNSRLTLAGLRIDSGEVDEGLADFRMSLERAVDRGYFAVIGRGQVNLASALEGVGRSREAVDATDQGIELTTRYGLKDSTSWVLGNRAESLQSLGRWEEAVRAVADARRLAQNPRAIALAACRRADLALDMGDLAKAERELAITQEYYGTHDPQPQNALVMARHALRIAARQGRLLDARSILQQALDAGFPPGTQRYAWPLLWAATTAEADARGLPAAEPGRAAILARIRDAAKRLPQLCPVWSAFGLAVDAELRRAEGRETPDAWAGAVAAFEPLERPHELARACYRWAESLLHGSERATTGLRGRTPREAAVLLLTQAHTAAVTMGARPLADELELLAQRARIPLPGLTPADTAGTAGAPAGNGRAAAEAPAPSDTAPAESLGLTPRERDVLRLVADGRSNRQIADVLFISPKTASVHVSNILAKLGVSGRGEAGAVAHRLRLFGEPTPG
ncbi:helix-turn-helix transcriptional regulator [Streptomyces sp. Isolate_219]|uniref:helix-turn-helix transcriptional regulator n=1 Tax=Streptomyces sp. Isolate_219 TaxID=2950110 RepID=UPI0021C6C3BE|nr:helix-turn-helix transcriptional regulator [Streptomyces sp. Isolate_219]MCR8578631.1 AAA family ATPase [Streptomyces sp. Isolate_219]